MNAQPQVDYFTPSIRQLLLTRFELAGRELGLTEWQLGKRSVGAGQFLARLRAGKMSLRVIEQAEVWCAQQILAKRQEDAAVAARLTTAALTGGQTH